MVLSIAQAIASTTLLVLSQFISNVDAGPTPNTLAACQAIYQKYPLEFAWDPLGPNGIQTLLNASLYDQSNTNYWNEANSQNRAACNFFPASASAVSYAVKILNKYPDVQYALQSGGHNANLGFSSVNQGVKISFRPNMQSTTISADRRTADVQPGSRWDEALTTLDAYGKAIVGGRLGHVGVAGYILGGGLSFLTSQYGFAADTIVNYELVMADGSIVNANRSANTDLFYALQGGGNQFGIVTKFTMKTFDIGQIWGGTRIYNGADYQALLAAAANFTENFSDPKAAVIVTNDFTLGSLVELIVVFFFYDGPAPPPGSFADFDAVNPISDSTKTQSYPDLLTANSAFSLSGLRYQIREATYPNLPYANMTSFLNYHFETFKQQTLEKTALNLDIEVLSFAIQPIPVKLIDASNAAGGNRLGLNSANGDRIFMEYDISWINPICDSSCPLIIEEIVTSIQTYQKQNYGKIPPTHYQSGDLSFIPYNPIFMNDGMYDQRVLQSYGRETYLKMKKIQKARDPKGFFSTRQDGFKF